MIFLHSFCSKLQTRRYSVNLSTALESCKHLPRHLFFNTQYLDQLSRHCCICCYVVGSARCRDTSQYFDDNTSCYVFYSHVFLKWYDARNKCLRNDGDLASFTTVHSNVGLSKLVTSPHWVGLRNSWWTWLDGRQFITSVHVLQMTQYIVRLRFCLGRLIRTREVRGN